MDSALYANYLNILKHELVPALGCTEPIAIAYASAKAVQVLGEFPDTIEMSCSGNIIKNVKGGDMVRLFVADAIGSVIAERTADCMQTEVAAYIASRGYKNTNRFSPGYCGWHVSEQRRLFSLFPQSAPCGVTLTDSCLMIPIKSVSGVIGIGSSVRCLDYSCGLCDMKQCYKRRARGIAENQ